MALHELGAFKTTYYDDHIEGFYIDLVDTFARVFWDDATEEVVVYRYDNLSDWTNKINGYIITEGSIYPYDAIHVGEKSSYKFCQGSNLVEFSQFVGLPIFVKQVTSNHYSCAQVVCDLAFQGPPIIIAASDDNSPGSVEVLATSSNGNIQYWPSEINYGQGQVSGKLNLLPGTYTIWAVDEGGCKKSITITIPIGDTAAETHFLKYFGTYSNVRGDRTRIEIHERNYTGDPIELGTDQRPQLAASPFIVSWGSNGDLKNHPIKVSEATIKLISYTDYQFLEFYTNESQYYQVKIYRTDENGPLLWWGYVTPELYGEPYIHPPYEISLVCNDGLGDLQKIPFALINYVYEQTSPYTGRMTHLQVIVECLKKIGNELPIITAINTVEDLMGYENVPNILKYTFETDVDEDYPNDLQEGVKYIFKVKNNLNIGIYYGLELIYNGEPATGLVNSDFSDGLNGWSQSQNGFASEAWVALGATTVNWDKPIYSDSSSLRTNYLFQAFSFGEGVEYTIDIDFIRYIGAGEGKYKVKVLIGVPGNGQEVYDSGFIDTAINPINFTFTPTFDFGFLYFWVEFETPNDEYLQVVVDSIIVTGDPATGGEATFEYTPGTSHEDISIDILGGDETTVEIYEAIQDAFNQVYVNTDNYTSKGGMWCFDVIEEQLKIYGARMYQANGAWHIVRFDQQNTEYLRNKYDKDGNFLESDYFNPIFNITHPSASEEDIWIYNQMNMEMKPGYRLQSVNQDLGYIENLIKGGDLNSIDGWSYGAVTSNNPEFFEFVQVDQGNYAISWKGNAQSVFLFSIRKIKAFFQTTIPREGVPATGQLQGGDIVIIGNTSNLINSGIYRVVEDGDWERVSVLPQDIFLPSYGGQGQLFSVSNDGPNYTITKYDYEDIPQFPYKDSYFIRNAPVNIEFAANDVIAFKINKYLKHYTSNLDYRLRVEVKVGEMYLSDDLVFTDNYNFLELPIAVDKSFALVEFTGLFKEAGTGDLTVKIFPSVHNETLGDEDVWGSINLDFGPSFNPAPNLFIDYVKAIYMPQGILPDVDRTQTLNNSKRFYEIPSTIEVMHGDSPEVLNRDKIYSYYLTLKDGTLTKKWHRKGFFESKNLLKLLLEIVLSNNLNNNELITGNIRNLLSLNDVIFDPMNPERLFMMNYVEWDEMKHESNVEIVEIKGLPEDETAQFSYAFSLAYKS